MLKITSDIFESFIASFVNRFILPPPPKDLHPDEIERNIKKLKELGLPFLLQTPSISIPAEDWLPLEKKSSFSTSIFLKNTFRIPSLAEQIWSLLPSRELLSQSVQVRELDFSFPSDFPDPGASDYTALGKAIIPQTEANSPLRAVIFLHGWLTPDHSQGKFIALELAKAGVATFLLELPHHIRRAKRWKFSGSTMISPDLFQFFRAIKQAIADTYKLSLLLRRRGYSEVSLMGVSLGAYIAALTASISPENSIKTLSMVMPPADLAYTFAHAPILKKPRSYLKFYNIDESQLTQLLEQFSLYLLKPPLPPDKIFILNGLYDRISFPEKVRALSQKWGYTHLIEAPYGHAALYFAREPILQLLAELLPELSPEFSPHLQQLSQIAG